MAYPRRSLSRRRVAAFAVALCVAVLGGVALGAAQPATSPPIRFSVFAAQPVADLAFVPRPGAAPQKVHFFPTARSAKAEYRGPMPLRFSDATGATVVAEAAIPAGLRDALLLFSPFPDAARAGGLRYQITVVDESSLRLSAGGLAIINLSGLALAGTVNAAPVAVSAGLNPAITVGRSAKIELQTTFKGRAYRSYAATVALKAGERALLILFPPFNPGSLEVMPRVLIDQPAVAPKAAK
jgi:hypothetical protein